MTVDIRPDPPTPLTRVPSVLDEAHPFSGGPWPIADEDVINADAVYAANWPGGWTPPRPEPEPEHHCPDSVCAELAAAFNLEEQAADWRSLAAWARTVKADIRRARATRGKRVKMLRRQYAGKP